MKLHGWLFLLISVCLGGEIFCMDGKELQIGRLAISHQRVLEQDRTISGSLDKDDETEQLGVLAGEYHHEMPWSAEFANLQHSIESYNNRRYQTQDVQSIDIREVRLQADQGIVHDYRGQFCEQVIRLFCSTRLRSDPLATATVRFDYPLLFSLLALGTPVDSSLSALFLLPESQYSLLHDDLIRARVVTLYNYEESPYNRRIRYRSNELLNYCLRAALTGNTNKEEMSANIRQLLKNGAQLRARDTLFGMTCLMWACALGNTVLVELLLEGATLLADTSAGPDDVVMPIAYLCSCLRDTLIGIEDDYGADALYYAARNGHANIVRLLLSKKANPEKRDMNGNTAEQYAVLLRKTEVLKVFEELVDKASRQHVKLQARM